MADLGQAYVQIIPSAEGISGKITETLEPEMQSAGQKGGESLANKIQSSLDSAGGKMTKAISLPIAAGAAASVAAWKEVDEAMDTITIKTGASGEALADMQQRAKNLAESMPISFQTAGDAVGEVNTRFGLTGDALESLSGQFAMFAELNDTDVSSSIDSVQSAMAAWGISADDASLVLDTLNKAGQDTGISVDKLSGMLSSNKTVLDEAGMSFSDAAMFCANLDKNGVDAGTAMTGLKKALQNATKEGKPANQALQELQEKMGDGSNKAEAYAAATELFGAKAGPAIADACMEGRLSFDQLGTSMGDFAGNVEGTFNETLDPMDNFTMAMNTMKDIGSEIVEVAGPLILDVLTILRDTLTSLKEKWDGLSEGQQQTILAVIGVVAALGPLMSIISGVIGVVTTIQTLMTVLTPIIAGVSLPIIGIVAAVAAAVAAGILLYENWDIIKEKAGQLKDWISEKWEALKQAVSNTVENLKQAVTDKWNALKTNVTTTVENIKNGIQQKFVDMVRDVLGRVIAIKEGIRERFQEAKDNALQIFENIKNGVRQKFVDMVRDVLLRVGAIKEGISDRFEQAKDTALRIFDDIKNGIKDKIEWAKDKVSGIVDTIKNLFDFDWSLPDLKLPHISITEYLDVPGLGTIPAPWGIHVDWYAKAYDSPYLFTSPTVMNGRGFGDRGSHNGGELVYSHDKLMEDIRRASSGGTFAPTINIYTQEGQSNEAIANYVMEKLTREYQRAARYV